MSKFMDNRIENIFCSKIAIAVLRYLWVTDQGSTGRQIAAAIKYSPQAAHLALKLLLQFNIIKAQDIGKAKSYQINRKHWLVSDVFVPAWKKIDSWLTLLGEYYMKKLSVQPLVIVAFGSYIKGGATEKSDLDLLFIYKDKDVSADSLDELLEIDSAIFEKFGVHPSCKLVKLSEFKKEVQNKQGLMQTIFKEGKAIAGPTLSEIL